jgi:hypothetical protein
MVATMSRIGPLRGALDLLAQQRKGPPAPHPSRAPGGTLQGGRLVLPLGQQLVLVAGQLATGEAEPAAAQQTLRVGGAGLVERPAHRRAPVDDDGVARGVADVPAPDVEALRVRVGATEERRDAGVVRQGDEPFGARGAQPFGGPGVDAGVGDRDGGGAHLGEAVGRADEVLALGGEDGIGGGLVEGGGVGREGRRRHGRRTLRVGRRPAQPTSRAAPDV